MQAHRGRLSLRESLHCVEDQILMRNVCALHHVSIAFLKLINADLILVFTVPRGSPVLAAISEWVSPSKNANFTEFCCSEGRSFITCLTFSISEFRSISEAKFIGEANTTSSTDSVGFLRRSASIARLRAITASHAPMEPRPCTKESGFLQIWKNISCITSSAWPGSFSTRSATEYTMLP